ncbi:MAG: UDP-3-O-(3-hydroxymyristoyl)glucosamine N-acyltransferase, partial [Alphaproteobacteria bacterium]
VKIGRHCVLSGQCGIAGSVTIEDYAVLGGGAGIADHTKIGAGAQIAGRAAVMRDVPPGDRQAGYPAMPAREYFRQLAVLKKLGQSGKRKSGN